MLIAAFTGYFLPDEPSAPFARHAAFASAGHNNCSLPLQVAGLLQWPADHSMVWPFNFSDDCEPLANGTMRLRGPRCLPWRQRRHTVAAQHWVYLSLGSLQWARQQSSLQPACCPQAACSERDISRAACSGPEGRAACRRREGSSACSRPEGSAARNRHEASAASSRPDVRVSLCRWGDQGAHSCAVLSGAASHLSWAHSMQHGYLRSQCCLAFQPAESPRPSMLRNHLLAGRSLLQLSGFCSTLTDLDG